MHFPKKGYSYVSFDDSLELAMVKNDPKTFLEMHRVPIIIDEAQKDPELFPELEKIVNETRLTKGKNAIICTADKISITNDGTYILPISSI